MVGESFEPKKLSCVIASPRTHTLNNPKPVS